MPYLPRPKRKKQTYRSRNIKGWGDQKFLHSKRWKSVREVQLRHYPICEVHESAGILLDVTQGGHVDHIIPRSKGGAPLDFRNLMTLCEKCHRMKTGLETHNDIIPPANDMHGELYPSAEDKEQLIKRLAERI